MSKQQDWRQTLPEDWKARIVREDGTEVDIPLRNHPVLEKYTSKDEAVKALVHTQRMLGRTPEGFVQMPADDAASEQWDRFHTALGRPASPTEYMLPEIDTPEEFEIFEDVRQQFLEVSHRLGLTPRQVCGLYEWFLPLNISMAMDDLGKLEQQAQEELDDFRAVHRGDAPQVLERARQAALALGGEELLSALDETRAGNRAAVISAFARVAPLVLEGSMRSCRSTGGILSLEQLREMMTDPRYETDPELFQRVADGFKALYPGKHQGMSGHNSR